MTVPVPSATAQKLVVGCGCGVKLICYAHLASLRFVCRGSLVTLHQLWLYMDFTRFANSLKMFLNKPKQNCFIKMRNVFHNHCFHKY